MRPLGFTRRHAGNSETVSGAFAPPIQACRVVPAVTEGGASAYGVQQRQMSVACCSPRQRTTRWSPARSSPTPHSRRSPLTRQVAWYPTLRSNGSIARRGSVPTDVAMIGPTTAFRDRALDAGETRLPITDPVLRVRGMGRELEMVLPVASTPEALAGAVPPSVGWQHGAHDSLRRGAAWFFDTRLPRSHRPLARGGRWSHGRRARCADRAPRHPGLSLPPTSQCG